MSPFSPMTLAFALLAGVLMASPVRAGDCAEFSYQRNAIFKAAGYCFHTPEQIRNFGNAGCAYDNVDDVPLSARQRAQVAEIVRTEREMGCR